MERSVRADARGDRRRREPAAARPQQGRPARRAERATSCACAIPTRCSSAAPGGEGLEQLGERIERELRHTLRPWICWCPTPRAAAWPSCTSSPAKSAARTPPTACACTRWCRRGWPSASRASPSPRRVGPPSELPGASSRGSRPGHELAAAACETQVRARTSQGGKSQCGAYRLQRRGLPGSRQRPAARAEGSRRSALAARQARGLNQIARRHRLEL